MQLWQFDRSDSSGSLSLDMNKGGLILTRIMLGYYLINNEHLVLDSTIHKLNGIHYVSITRERKVERLILAEESSDDCWPDDDLLGSISRWR